MLLGRSLAGCLLAGSLCAQIPQFPGQYPGQTPLPGTYPPTIPGPRRNPAPRPSAPATTRIPINTLETRLTEGILRELERDQLVIESDDHRIVWFRIGDDLVRNGEIDPQKFHLGDHVAVESTQDDIGNYTAVTVQWKSAATNEDLAVAEQNWDLPREVVVPEPAEKSEKPKLTRGKPTAAVPEATVAEAHKIERVRTGPMPTRADDPAITKAREAAVDFLETLPSFAAKQNTTRYIQETARGQWRALDLVTAELVFKDGTEDYRNIKINNKTTSKPLEEIDGLRSTGEFGTILANIFDPETGTDFSKPSQVTLRTRRAWRYNFEVPRERSDFRIMTPSQHYYSAHGGAIWIDFETSRVLRIEIQARNLPKAFPFDTVEMNIDYDFIRLDGAKQFLLPTESEILNCIRDTSVCMKNSTSFRNYVKFNAESDIIFQEPK